MERLTKREISGITYNNSPGFMCSCYCDNCSKGTGDCDRLKAMVNRLAKFEDLEEQGLLVRLPCKVGDIVWELCLCDDGNYKIFPMIVKTISEYGTLRQVKKDKTIWNIYAESDYTYMYKSFVDFGKTVFNTKEEAEKKLEEMKKECKV